MEVYMKNIKEFKPLIRLLGSEKKKLVIASLVIFVCCLTDIFTGYLIGNAVESITNMQLKKALYLLIIYLVMNLTFGGAFINMAYAMLYKVESYLTRSLGFNTYKKALNLPAEAFEKHSSGEIINRINNDADTLSFVFGRLLSIFSSIVITFVLFIYILINSWIIALEIATILAILFYIIKVYTPKIKEAHKERKAKQDKFASITTESIRGIREIKTLGIKNNLISDVYTLIKDLFNTSKKEIDIQMRFDILTRLMRALMEVGTFIICIFLIYYGKISLSFFISMTYYVYRYCWFIENLNDFTGTYQKTVVAIGRVNEILENKLYQDESFGNKTIKNKKGYIEFRDVTFAYPNESNTLNNFNLKIEPNKKIAVVGKSGQGKSTLFNLLTRVFDVKEGEILVDDVNIKSLTEDELRKNISIIRQDPFIFNRTIKDNFKLVNPKITLKEIRKYAKLAYIDDYIMSLPKKYNTILGEGGVNLSGGQKQRLAIARTLSKKGKIILFDEATSALDNESQEFVKQAIDNLVKDHTIVIVAHRLSTIIDADIIYVIDDGQVVDSGTHNDLLLNSNIYKNLYETESLNS
jgi:ATP-binding cassette subfamily B protein